MTQINFEVLPFIYEDEYGQVKHTRPEVVLGCAKVTEEIARLFAAAQASTERSTKI